jgi:hypothetical protein
LEEIQRGMEENGLSKELFVQPEEVNKSLIQAQLEGEIFWRLKCRNIWLETKKQEVSTT